MKQNKFSIFNFQFSIKEQFLNSKFKILNSNSGFTMVMVLVAVLVLFTTISFIKIGSMQSVNPDLRRIGINIGPSATPNNLADKNLTTNPIQPDDTTDKTSETPAITIASTTIDVESDIEAEGDNPTYIE